MKKSLIFFLGVFIALSGYAVRAYASQTVDENDWNNVLTVVPLTGTTPSIGGGLLSAGACSSATTSINGATIAMGVVATPATTTDIGALAIWKGWVSATNVVTVNVCAIILGTPVATPYNIRVVK
jgi:hypothetical protein